MQTADGNLYGTTTWGGISGAYYGTVFKITPTGTLTTLYKFCSLHDFTRRLPMAGLALGADGNFYGSTAVAGTGCYIWGCGTIFKITPGGALTTLYNFNEYDGDGPSAALVEGSDGNFYGTTTWGGSYFVGPVFARPRAR